MGGGGQASRAGRPGGGGRGRQCRLGSSRAGKRRCPSDHGSVPGGVQPGGEQAGGGRAGTAGWLGGGGEGRLAARCHSRGCAQKPPVTTPSASTGWTICSTWPTESRGNSAPAPLSPAPRRPSLDPFALMAPIPHIIPQDHPCLGIVSPLRDLGVLEPTKCLESATTESGSGGPVCGLLHPIERQAVLPGSQLCPHWPLLIIYAEGHRMPPSAS